MDKLKNRMFFAVLVLAIAVIFRPAVYAGQFDFSAGCGAGPRCADMSGAEAGGAGGGLVPVLPGGELGGDDGKAPVMSLKEQRAAAAMSFISREKRLAMAGAVTRRSGVRLVSATVVKPVAKVAPKAAGKVAVGKAGGPVVKEVARPAAKAVESAASGAVANIAPVEHVKPAVKGVAKPAVKPAAVAPKAAVKPAAKPVKVAVAARSEVKSVEVAGAAKAAVKSAAVVSAPAGKPAAKGAGKPVVKDKAPASGAVAVKKPVKPVVNVRAKPAPKAGVAKAAKGKSAGVKAEKGALGKLPGLSEMLALAPPVQPQEVMVVSRVGEPFVEPVVDSDIYKIKSGDVLTLRSYPEGKLPPSVTVRPDGTVTLPIVGVVLAQGHTVFELSDLVVEKLKQYIKFPWVEFSVGESSAKKIRVFGEVVRPGIIILKDNFKVIDILPQMGGFTNFSDTANVRLIHSDGSEMRLNIDSVVQNPGAAENALLQNGDILFVPRLEQGKDIVSVLALGAFNKQGKIALTKDRARLMDAISETGGFTVAADMKNVKVMALDEGGAKERASLDLERALTGKDMEGLNIPLQDGDIIFAPTLDTRKKQKKLDKANEMFKTYSPTIGLLILLQNNAK